MEINLVAFVFLFYTHVCKASKQVLVGCYAVRRFQGKNANAARLLALQHIKYLGSVLKLYPLQTKTGHIKLEGEKKEKE